MSPRKQAAPRVGPKMRMVTWYVYRHPGCPKLHAAEFAAPGADKGTPGIGYGYASVDRAIRAGLVTADRTRGKYSLTLTSAGKALLKSYFGVNA